LEKWIFQFGLGLSPVLQYRTKPTRTASPPAISFSVRSVAAVARPPPPPRCDAVDLHRHSPTDATVAGHVLHLIHRHPYLYLRVEEKSCFATRSPLPSRSAFLPCATTLLLLARQPPEQPLTRLRPHLPEQSPGIELPATKPSPQEVAEAEPTSSAPTVRAPHRQPRTSGRSPARPLPQRRPPRLRVPH
jgi:hypothetical protein